MPREIGRPEYIKYTDCKGGDKLVEMGEYLGTTEGKYGIQHRYLEVSSGAEKVLNSAGQLNYIMDSKVDEGDVVDVVFKGKTILESGPFKGKEANNFAVSIYTPSEIAEIEEKFDISLAKSVTPKKVTKVVKESAEDLDDLE